MANAAYTAPYRQRWAQCQPLFVPANQDKTEAHRLTAGYTVQVTSYAGKVAALNLTGSECRLLNGDGHEIANWRSIDDDGAFYKIITHSNGNNYLLFRQDLYGYSVLDIAAGTILQFFPERSLKDAETFIWTDVDYNPASNVLAVSGCYWACPNSTHLFTFAQPMHENQLQVDMVECFEGGYDTYDDVLFVSWEQADLRVTRYAYETNTRQEVLVPAEEYSHWLSQNGQPL